MQFHRRIAAALAAGALLATSGVLAEAAPVYDPPKPAVTVYNTPGVQFVNGRTWRTQCDMYSSNVVRCRTEIWATQVIRQGNRYRQINGWAFNNLTYLPSDRDLWKGNNLAHNANWTSTDGRRWRTECDTSTTGRGGCRSYIYAWVVASVNGGYRTEQRWIFNNQVQFSSSAVPDVTTVPKSALARAVLTPTGFGPIQIGTKVSDMHGAYLAPGNLCSEHRASAEVRALGVDLMDYRNGTIGNLWSGSNKTPIGDASGVSTFRLGMTLADLRAAFPGKVKLVTRNSEGGAFQGAAIQEGGVELLFHKDWEDGDMMKLLPTDVLTVARAREASAGHFYGC